MGVVSAFAAAVLAATPSDPARAGEPEPHRLFAGGERTCLLDPDGVARCWGSAEFGTLLTTEGVEMCGTERRPEACAREPVALGGGSRWRSLAVGGEQMCGIRADGVVVCWGRDWLGSLGRGDAPLESCVYDLGEARDCSLDLDTGQVYCADQGEHEIKKTPCGRTPEPVQGLAEVREILAVGPAFCALTPAPVCWGSDEAAGSLHTCALTVSGQVLCWGADHLGQVGAHDHSCTLDYVFDPGPAPCQLTPVRSWPR